MVTIATVKEDLQEMAGNLVSFRKSFPAERQRVAVGGKVICGFPDNAFQGVDSQYKVQIENSDYIINAWMQEMFKFTVSSDWDPLLKDVDIPLITDIGHMVIKGTSGYTAKNVALTRRKWKGSSHLRIGMRLEFRAINDAKTEVLTPIQALQEMVLPSEVAVNGNSGQKIWGVLVPPGPNELYVGGKTGSTIRALRPSFGGNNDATTALGGTGDDIKVSLFGGKFILDMAVVISAEATFDKRMTARGPVAGTAEVIFESYEMMTKDKLRDAYSGVGYTVGNSPTALTNSLPSVKVN